MIRLGNIVLLIIFLILRPIIGQLLKSQRTQKTRTPGEGKKYPPFPIHEFTTTPVEESKRVEIKPESLNRPIKIKKSRKESIKSHSEPKHQTNTEHGNDIPELLTQDSIIRGIIFKEILSPPKALERRNY
ncbi:MAG: hypothetical protein PHE70_11480 [Tepidanaerobacteraceae bacterium]|nr:hypothetical protein [Tepidanaerobacteraceae bacterium]